MWYQSRSRAVGLPNLVRLVLCAHIYGSALLPCSPTPFLPHPSGLRLVHFLPTLICFGMGTSTGPQAQVEDATVHSHLPSVRDGDEREGSSVADDLGDVAPDPRYRHPNAFLLFRQSFLKGSQPTWVEPKGKDIHKVIGEYD